MKRAWRLYILSKRIGYKCTYFYRNFSFFIIANFTNIDRVAIVLQMRIL